LSGAGSEDGNTENSLLTGTMQAGITAIGVGITSFILPAKLKKVQAIAKPGCMVELQWESLTEFDLSHYQIQYSRDGVQFENGSTVKANNRASRYTQTLPVLGATSYYRLAIVDKNGTLTYSEIVSFKSSTCGTGIVAAKLYPNPVTAGQALLHVAYDTKPQQVHLISITGANGQVISTRKITTTANKQLVEVPVAQLAAGLYYISIVDAGTTAAPIVLPFVKN
jgi:hypothetical protein